MPTLFTSTSTGPSCASVSPISTAGASGSARSRATERSAELLSGLFDALGTAAGDNDQRTFVYEKPRRLEADSPCRPGDDADAVAQAGVHGRLAYRGDDDHPARAPW